MKNNNQHYAGWLLTLLSTVLLWKISLILPTAPQSQHYYHLYFTMRKLRNKSLKNLLTLMYSYLLLCNKLWPECSNVTQLLIFSIASECQKKRNNLAREFWAHGLKSSREVSQSLGQTILFPIHRFTGVSSTHDSWLPPEWVIWGRRIKQSFLT